MLALFRRYPALAAELPHRPLGTWPTPVRHLKRLSEECAIYVKDDGHSGEPYGGNKVRKLEFLLADALAQGASEVMTFGVAGSNHALATAIYAERVGLRCISILTPQRNARYVARNLLAALATNAELHHYPNEPAAVRGSQAVSARRLAENGLRPVVIPGGGSSALGTVGFVNAAFELAEQIENAGLPVPDKLYVALGTMGTAAGLLLGLRACGLKTLLAPVRVVHPDIGNIEGMRRLYEQTSALLRAADPSFPDVPFDFDGIRHEQYGERYAVFTPAGMAARRRLQELEGLRLEGTYTAKAMAALLADLEAGALKGQTVLFWNTYNGADLGARTAGLDYHDLPVEFHTYFERPVQPLDED